MRGTQEICKKRRTTKQKPRFYDYKDPRTINEVNPLWPSSNSTPVL